MWTYIYMYVSVQACMFSLPPIGQENITINSKWWYDYSYTYRCDDFSHVLSSKQVGNMTTL
jgi:hypothetical protein